MKEGNDLITLLYRFRLLSDIEMEHLSWFHISKKCFFLSDERNEMITYVFIPRRKKRTQSITFQPLSIIVRQWNGTSKRISPLTKNVPFLMESNYWWHQMEGSHYRYFVFYVALAIQTGYRLRTAFDYCPTLKWNIQEYVAAQKKTTIRFWRGVTLTFCLLHSAVGDRGTNFQPLPIIVQHWNGTSIALFTRTTKEESVVTYWLLIWFDISNVAVLAIANCRASIFSRFWLLSGIEMEHQSHCSPQHQYYFYEIYWLLTWFDISRVLHAILVRQVFTCLPIFDCIRLSSSIENGTSIEDFTSPLKNTILFRPIYLLAARKALNTWNIHNCTISQNNHFGNKSSHHESANRLLVQ